MGIFEPIPFKGDENMLVDARERAIMGEEEDDNQLFVAPNAAANDKAREKELKHQK